MRVGGGAVHREPGRLDEPHAGLALISVRADGVEVVARPLPGGVGDVVGLPLGDGDVRDAPPRGRSDVRVGAIGARDPVDGPEAAPGLDLELVAVGPGGRGLIEHVDVAPGTQGRSRGVEVLEREHARPLRLDVFEGVGAVLAEGDGVVVFDLLEEFTVAQEV